MRAIKKFILFALTLVAVLFPLSSRSFAEQKEAKDTGGEYSVVPDCSEQTDQQLGYFDLKVVPGESKDLSLAIHNMGKEAHVYQISVHTATTNKNNIVDYSLNSFIRDPSLKFSIKDLVQPQKQEVSVAAGETKRVTMHLQVPSQAFSGILLGGINIQPKEDENDKARIKSVFMHTIAVRLQEGKAVPAKLTAGKAEIRKSGQEYQITSAMRNPVAKLMTDVSGKLEIKNKKSGKVFQTKELDNLSFAPNSCFTMPITLEKGLPAGEYSYIIQLRSRSGNFDFTRDFKVDKKSVIVEKKSYLWLYLFIVVVILIALIITVYRYRLRKNK